METDWLAWQALGIPVGGDHADVDIQAAYRRAALKLHPDRVRKADLRTQVSKKTK